MYIPLGTDRPLRLPTLTTYALLACNAVMFIAQMLVDAGAARRGGEAPLTDALMLAPGSPFWTFVTYQFLHGDIWHFGGNMLVLWVFGPNVEDRFGRLWFLLFYLVGGIMAGIVHLVVDGAAVIGASGAIAAVTGAYLVLFPRTRVRGFLFFFLIMPLVIPATWFIGFAIFKDIALRGVGSGNVATAAHLGGYAFGISTAFALLGTGLLSREPYDLLTLIKQSRRRRRFKELSASGDPWTARPTEPEPDSRRRRERAETDDQRMRLRTTVTRAVGTGDAEAAERAYRALLDAHADDTLPRAAQLALANLLLASGRHEPASMAYDAFLRANPFDAESPRVRLMGALLAGRYLNDPVRAKALLAECEGKLRRDDEIALWRTLRDELG